MVKSGYTPWIMSENRVKVVQKHIGYLPIIFISMLCSRNKLIQKYESAVQKYNNLNSKALFEQAGASNYGQWVIPRKCFDELIELNFEGESFKCPKDYDTYLKAAYGDYMTLPPKEKRKNRHKIIKIKF